MSDLNLDLRDYAETPIQGPLPVQGSETAGQPVGSNQASTIEQSQEVASLLVPPLNFPILVPPSDSSSDLFEVVSVAVFSMNQKGGGWGEFILTQELKMQQIISDMLDGWLKNIREIEDQVRELLNSSTYQAQQQIRLKGDPSQGVSGVQSGTEANLAINHPTGNTAQQTSLIAFLDHAKTIERVPPNATIPDTNAPDNPTQALTIPLTAAILAGGSLALGAVESHTSTTGMSSNPLNGPMEIVDQFQPLYPQLVQDVIPMINLAVMPLVYFTSWDNAIGNIRNRERENHLAEAQDFAKQVIKMVSDPAFVMMTFVNKMQGADQLAPERKDQLAAMTKLILASVALSLLYSVEVGKVMDGKFWGITPEEFRDLLSGQLAIGDPNDPKLSESQRLQLTLLGQINAQLGILPAEQRLETIETLFSYLTENKNIESMLDPTKVFRQVLEGGFVNSEVGATSLGNARI